MIDDQFPAVTTGKPGENNLQVVECFVEVALEERGFRSRDHIFVLIWRGLERPPAKRTRPRHPAGAAEPGQIELRYGQGLWARTYSPKEGEAIEYRAFHEGGHLKPNAFTLREIRLGSAGSAPSDLRARIELVVRQTNRRDKISRASLSELCDSRIFPSWKEITTVFEAFVARGRRI